MKVSLLSQEISPIVEFVAGSILPRPLVGHSNSSISSGASKYTVNSSLLSVKIRRTLYQQVAADNGTALATLDIADDLLDTLALGLGAVEDGVVALEFEY